MSAGVRTPPGEIGPQVGLARGTLLVLGAEALAFPAGLVATILLTRHLPADRYGTLALGLAAIAWLEWTVVTLFSRAAYKLAAEPDDAHGMAATVIRIYLSAGLVVGALVFAAADLAAGLFGVPALAPLLRVLAVEVPLFVTAQAYRTVLVGRGWHGSRAAVAAARWTVRAVLIALGVLLGFSLMGIAALIVVATAVELVLVRWRVGPGLRAAAATRVSVRRLLSFAAPLAISAICMRLFERLDLFAIRLLGVPLETVAAYGVAQNLALAPTLLGGALVPALIAALSYRFVTGDRAGAHETGVGALRVALLVLPAAGLAAGAAPVLVETFFGQAYRASAPLFAALILGAAGGLVLSVASGILVAAERPRWTILVTAPMLPLAVLGHVLAVPRAGAIGAALVTAATVTIAAAAACVAAQRLVGTRFPLKTLARTVIVASAAFWAGTLLPGPGATGLLGVLALAVGVAAALASAGELTSAERALASRLLRSAARFARRSLGRSAA